MASCCTVTQNESHETGSIYNNILDEFYTMVGRVKQSSVMNPESSKQFLEDESIRQIETRYVAFSGEECFGKYLDLHELYNSFINAKFAQPYVNSMLCHRLKYVKYLCTFPGIDDENVIPAKYKTTLEYSRYIKDVLDYLISFMDRTRPLIFLDTIFKDLEAGGDNRGKKRSRAEIDQPNKLNKNQEQRVKETTLVEAKVRKLCEILSDTLEQTREHVRNKRPTNIIVRDLEDDENDNDSEIDDVDDEEDEKLVDNNPLKMPMGWNGKPIPYWLYKLQDFECEICGDYTYRGRRAFETHFSEARHQHGMHCLGIPNTKSFHGITSIQDAVNLWQHIQTKQDSTKWRPEVDEEFEDADGNVYDIKTYTYLAKQGLI